MVAHGWLEDDDITNIVPIPFKIKKCYTTYNKERPGFYIKIY